MVQNDFEVAVQTLSLDDLGLPQPGAPQVWPSHCWDPSMLRCLQARLPPPTSARGRGCAIWQLVPQKNQKVAWPIKTTVGTARAAIVAMTNHRGICTRPSTMSTDNPGRSAN